MKVLIKHQQLLNLISCSYKSPKFYFFTNASLYLEDEASMPKPKRQNNQTRVIFTTNAFFVVFMQHTALHHYKTSSS
jgi:hypothetical protein